MRMSSEMFPFASHAKYGYDLAFAAEGLKAAGDLAKKYGHRLTMHPGQASLSRSTHGSAIPGCSLIPVHSARFTQTQCGRGVSTRARLSM